MATTSETIIIKLHPIKEGLTIFCHLFETTCEDLGISLSSDAVPVVFSKTTNLGIMRKELLLELILALQNQPAVRILTSRIGDGTLLSDLRILSSRIVLNQYNIASAIPLVKHIVGNEADGQICNGSEIWDAVFDLVTNELLARTNTPPPPAVLDEAILNTPFRSSSATLSGIEQTHAEVDQRICEELKGQVFVNVGGFFERYFEEKTWSENAGAIYKLSRSQHKESRWSHWPQRSHQDSFLELFMRFQDIALQGRSRKYYTSANKALRGSEADRKLDIFLAPADATSEDGKHDWSNVLVIGEHKRNPDEDCSKAILVQLAGYAREVFGSQPGRRFVHGFTICGSVMRLWVFDRSGAYSSEKFDAHRDPERFVQVIAGYALMSDSELGLNTFIHRDGNFKYVVAEGQKIYLENEPIASQKAIVCRGTTCYRGRRSELTDWEYVVKFSWPSSKGQLEGNFFKLAQKRGVTGIAECFSHEKITIDGDPDSILHLRRDMEFLVSRKSPIKASWANGAGSSRERTASSVVGKSVSSADCSEGLGTCTIEISTRSSKNSSSEQKRKRYEGLVSRRGETKRCKPIDSQPDVAKLDHEKGSADTGNIHSTEEARANSLMGNGSEVYGNRIHCCLVVSPAGRPLQAYKSARELLEAFRDAIAGHKSLLEDGNILHRDVSENNIIITESVIDGDPKGRLIDLDLAKELDSVPSGASHRTGTMQFMAIEVLQGNGHTYRHDLESFFYVFIWMCIRYGHDNLGGREEAAASHSRPIIRRVRPGNTSILQGWYTGTYAQIANIKRGHMVGFTEITAEFAPEFINLKDLAHELRDVLFPFHGKLFFAGTYKDRNIMYGGMIDAFDKAISRLGKEPQVTT